MKATARRRRPSRSPIPYRNISRRLRSNQSHRRRVRRSKAAPWYAQCRRVWRRAVKRKSRLLLAIKTANKSVAEIGDAVQYTIEVKNLGHGAVEGVRVVDQLPAGFRYIEG